MGSLFKPSSVDSTSTVTPWGPQGSALQYGFDQLQNVMNSHLGTPYYQGDTYAPMDPLTQQGIDASAAFATGAGAQSAGNVVSSGNGLLPSGSGAQGALGNLAALAGRDPTQANIASAGAYANNPFMNDMIDAASRDVSRNLFENELPGINQAATASGNINSSRAGTAEAIARRGAGDRIADIAAQLRGDAYSHGLSLAEQAREGNMSGLSAAGSGLGDLYDLGLKGSALGQDLSLGNSNALISGGQLGQQDAQGALNADFQKWQGGDTRDLGFLTQYMNAVSGIPSFGTTTSSQPGPSPFQSILGGGISALGAYSMLGGKMPNIFSDPALKTNVQYTGDHTKHGIPICTWDYIDTPGLDLPKGRQVGVMATDVAKVLPEAVGLQDGYLTVDYGKLR